MRLKNQNDAAEDYIHPLEYVLRTKLILIYLKKNFIQI